MDTKLFAQTVQTFGASPSRWETDQKDALADWGKTDGAEMMQEEMELDKALDLVVPPDCTGLSDRIQKIIAAETMQRQIVLFWKISPWVSFLFMVCGFSLGWYQHYLNHLSVQNYFNTLFDTFYEQY